MIAEAAAVTRLAMAARNASGKITTSIAPNSITASTSMRYQATSVSPGTLSADIPPSRAC